MNESTTHRPIPATTDLPWPYEAVSEMVAPDRSDPTLHRPAEPSHDECEWKCAESSPRPTGPAPRRQEQHPMP